MITNNGRPSDPLSAAQYAINGVFNAQIPFAGANRSTGQYFPNISGDFLRVEASDLPCRIGFGNVGINDSIPVCPGDVFNGRFSGITIFHENYVFVGGSSFYQLVLSIGRGVTLEKSVENRSVPVSAFINVSASSTTALNGTIYFPQRYNRYKGQIVCEAGNIAAANGKINFVAFNETSITVNLNGVNYVSNPPGFASIAEAKFDSVLFSSTAIFDIDFAIAGNRLFTFDAAFWPAAPGNWAVRDIRITAQ